MLFKSKIWVKHQPSDYKIDLAKADTYELDISST